MGSRKGPKGPFLLTIVPKYVIIEITNINKHMNKYTQWYTTITKRAKTRHLKTYTESHHIVPRSLGGSDEPDNLVNLTAREHFVCHWLLVKMTTGQDHHKMQNYKANNLLVLETDFTAKHIQKKLASVLVKQTKVEYNRWMKKKNKRPHGQNAKNRVLKESPIAMNIKKNVVKSIEAKETHAMV